MDPQRGLIVEDEPAMLASLMRVLDRRLPNGVIDTATTLEEGLAKVDASLSWVLIDLCLGPPRAPGRNLDGLTLALEMRARKMEVPIVFMTGMLDAAEVLDPEPLRASRILTKPFSMDELVVALMSAGDGHAARQTTLVPPPPRTLPEIDAAAEQEKLDRVAQLLERFHGSKRATAKYLGVHRRTIDRLWDQLVEVGRPPARARNEPLKKR